MEVTITYADYDKEVKNASLGFEDLSTLNLNVKETIVELPSEPVQPEPTLRSIAEEDVVIEKTLEITAQFLESEVKVEMPYGDLQEYIAILQKIAKQIRPTQTTTV